MPETETANVKQDKTVAYFSRWAKTYEKGPMVGWFKTVHAEVIRAVAPGPNDNVLDVACGTGKALRAMAAMAQSGELAGLDMSKEMIAEAAAKAREQGIPNLQYHVGSADSLPFDDQKFDHVTCMNAFHHFPDQKKSLEEMVRVSKIGGSVYIADMTGHVLPCPVAGHKVWNVIEWFLTPQVNALSRRQFRELFREVGLEDVRQLPASQLHRRCGRYWLWAGAAQLAGGVFWLPLIATGLLTGLVGLGISFPYLSKTITVGKRVR
jgi:ubiquinone/menaquinone biosynthesis C-methylase UbiE